MKLLLDENLPPTLIAAISLVYPGFVHVHHCGCGAAHDTAIWAYAREHGFASVTKDSDFEELSMMKGMPPKVIWLRTGNCTTAALADVIERREKDIADFLAHDLNAILETR